MTVLAKGIIVYKVSTLCVINSSVKFFAPCFSTFLAKILGFKLTSNNLFALQKVLWGFIKINAINP